MKWAGSRSAMKLSLEASLLRIPEALYTRTPADRRRSGERQFDYVDPGKRDYQREMEDVASGHLKRIGAYLNPQFKSVPPPAERFPVRASVVIPVRNRERTIHDAVKSALSRRPVRVHVSSSIITRLIELLEILKRLASEHARMVSPQPTRTDLGIGGC